MSYLSLGGTNDDSSDFMATQGKGIGASGNSNLSALFGLNNQITNNPNSNQALTYTAPKPPGKATPKQQQQQQSTGGGSGVACAVAVTAYRYVNGQNVNQGKLGAAVLKNVAEKDYKILMYVTKQQPVSTAQINPSFQFTVQPNNYASFSDDQKQTWTILFASTSQLHDFAKQICLAKFFTSAQAPNGNVIQDLVLGENRNVAVESGDSLEMKYTGWLVNRDGSLGAMFDSNHNAEKTFRFKTGRGKVIKGWETGMIGMRSGGKRFLVIPPHLAYGQKAIGNKIPPNSTLSFEVDLLRVKQSKDNASIKSGESVESLPQAVATEQPPPPNPVALPAVQTSLVPPDNTQETVKGRTASLNDQLTNIAGDSSKNALVSRMARMGQAMIPVVSAHDGLAPVEQGPVAVMQGHDSTPPTISPDISQPLSRSSTPSYNPAQPTMQPPQSPHFQASPMAQPNPVLPHSQPQQLQPSIQSYHSPQHHPNLAPQNPVHVSSQPNQGIQSYYDPSAMVSNPGSVPTSGYNSHTVYRQSPQYPPHSLGYGAELVPIILSETKQQSTEVRLLQEKVDKVSGLVEEVKKLTEDNNSNRPKLSASQTMDAEVIMLNVQRIMKENEELKQTISQKNQRIEKQSEKISDLLQQNQKYVEKSNMMLEQRNDSFKESFTQSQARSLQLEQDKVDLTQRLSDATSKVSELTMEVTNMKQRESDLKQKFKELYTNEKERADTAEKQINELEGKLKESDKSLQSVASSGANAKSKIEDLQQEIVRLKESLANETTVLNETIAKLAEDKAGLENRVQEIQSRYQSELTELRNNTETASLQNKKQREEVNNLKEHLSKIEAQYKDTQDNLDASEQKITLYQQKFGQMRTTFEDQKTKLEEAMSEAEELAPYKQAYERLRSQASAMKEKYEEKILELKEELESKKESGGVEKANVFEEVKKIMNVIFQRLRTKIDTEEDYAGTEVLKIMVEIIKGTTLSLLKSEQQKTKESEGEESEEDSEDDDASPEETAESVEKPRGSFSETQKLEKSVPEKPFVPEKPTISAKPRGSFSETQKLEKVVPEKPLVSEKSSVPGKPTVSAKPIISAPKPSEVSIKDQSNDKSTFEPAVKEGEIVDSLSQSIDVSEKETEPTVKEEGTEPTISEEETAPEKETKPTVPEEETEPTVSEKETEPTVPEEKTEPTAEFESSPEKQSPADQIQDKTSREKVVEDLPEDANDLVEAGAVPSNEEKSVSSDKEQDITTENEQVEPTGDFVVIDKTENEASDNEREVTESEKVAAQEQSNVEKDDSQSSEVASSLSVPAVDRQISSGSSISDDRKPPPLFDDDSDDDDDLDWLNS